MARQPRKSSTRFNRDQRERPGFPRESARSELKRAYVAGASSGPSPERILKVLADQPAGATAMQLSQAMGLDDGSRSLGLVLRRLVEQGQVLEMRPGRYQVSGSGGEFAAVLTAGPEEGALSARLGDGREIAVAPAYRLGARAGDVVQVAIGEDNLALVTRINRRSGREVVGTILFRPGGPLLVPDNRKEGQLPVLSAFARFHDQYRAGDRVVGTVSVDAEGKAGVHLERILGPETPEVADFRYVCLTHDLPGPFPAEVEEQAASYKDRLTLSSTKGAKREDLREDLVFTIDPATAKDFDDAISLAPAPGGGWILGVHIADVSHYVTEHSPLDVEAAARGTSIYLINRVIPMLPETLSNGLCSLVPHQERYCLSAFLTLDRSGNLTGTRLAETLIRSRHRLTYEEALAVLERRDEPGKWPADLKSTLLQVSEIAQSLRRAREKAGALNLVSVEHRFALDVEGQPTEVGREGTDISHQLIEECMLLANRAVARWLEDQGLPCIYRVHQEPDPDRMKQFGTVLENYGKDSRRITDRFGLQKLLGELRSEPPAARIVLNYLCLRSFKKAVYAVDNIGHYALAFASYAHFTSPIRRYPDLLVHRLVKRGLGLMGYRAVEIRFGYLDALAKQASWLEQRAEAAERDLDARKSARYLATRLGETFAGVVVTATPGGLIVQLLETGQEAFLPLRELEDDFYTYDQERMALIGRHSSRVLGVATELDVLIAAVDIERADVVLGLAPGGAKGAGTIDRGSKGSAERTARVQHRRDREAARDSRRRERRGKRRR